MALQKLLDMGPQAVLTVSGQHLYSLDTDDLMILTGYQMLRRQGGSMVVEFDWEGRAIRWDVKPNLGNANTLNEILRGRK